MDLITKQNKKTELIWRHSAAGNKHGMWKRTHYFGGQGQFFDATSSLII
jgi:hypothetical protein